MDSSVTTEGLSEDEDIAGTWANDRDANRKSVFRFFAAGVRIEQAFEAAAIANTLADPDLVAGEHFGVKINWGGVESANAFGITGAVVFSDGLFDNGNGRLAGSGGVAFSSGTGGGRAGLQLTW